MRSTARLISPPHRRRPHPCAAMQPRASCGRQAWCRSENEVGTCTCHMHGMERLCARLRAGGVVCSMCRALQGPADQRHSPARRRHGGLRQPTQPLAQHSPALIHTPATCPVRPAPVRSLPQRWRAAVGGAHGRRWALPGGPLACPSSSCQGPQAILQLQGYAQKPCGDSPAARTCRQPQKTGARTQQHLRPSCSARRASLRLLAVCSETRESLHEP